MEGDWKWWGKKRGEAIRRERIRSESTDSCLPECEVNRRMSTAASSHLPNVSLPPASSTSSSVTFMKKAWDPSQKR